MYAYLYYILAVTVTIATVPNLWSVHGFALQAWELACLVLVKFYQTQKIKFKVKLPQS
jgi:hypothetical protein